MSCTQPFSLLTYKTDKNFNIFKIKNFDILYIEKENMLKKLVFMGTFEEISRWVETHSKGKKFISNPLKANDTDRLDCLFAIQKPIFLALKTIEKRRKNIKKRCVSLENGAVIVYLVNSISNKRVLVTLGFGSESNFSFSAAIRTTSSKIFLPDV